MTGNRARRRQIWNQDTIVEAIKAWVEHYGWVPTAIDWSPAAAVSVKDGEARVRRFYDTTVGFWPGESTVRREFGSWAAGIHAAGFELHGHGRPPDNRIDPTLPEVREAVRLYRGGSTIKEIADELGRSKDAVHRWLKRCDVPRRKPWERTKARADLAGSASG